MTPDERFHRCLAEILKWEGGYVDDPRDPGGATNLGVTLATLSDWLGRSATKAEVHALTGDAVAPIYRAKYWTAVHGDDLPAGVDLLTFDASVNSGPARAAKWLQKAVGAEPDGQIGPATLAAVAASNAASVIDAIFHEREAFYRSLPTFEHFGKGWLSRLNGTATLAHSWVA